jgi:hypothetical protein
MARLARIDGLTATEFRERADEFAKKAAAGVPSADWPIA